MAKAEAAISPPMNPPPGSLCPRRSTKSENRIIKLVRYGAVVRKITVLILRPRFLLNRLLCGLPHTDTHRYADGKPGDHHHGDFAKRVETAEIDDDHIHDVASMRDHAGIFGKECAE